MAPRGLKTDSERLFAEYLERLGIGYDYEPEIGIKRPDFALNGAGGGYQALVEIEDLARPADGVKHEAPGGGPYRAIREKINVAREQLKFGKHLPCMLVLFDRDGCHPLKPRNVLGAMLGNVAIEVPLVASGTEDVEGQERLVCGRGGRMRIPKDNGQPQNTTISAVAVLEQVAVDQHRSGYLAELKARTEALPAGSHSVLSEAFDALDGELRRRYAAQGVDFDRIVPRLRLYRNPYARKPWPASLISDADEVWALDERRSVMAPEYNGLAPGGEARP